MRSPALYLVTGAWLLGVPASDAEVTFQYLFTNQALVDFTAAEQALIVDEISFWDNVIDGYRDGTTRTWTVTIDSFNEAAVGGAVSTGYAIPGSLTWSGFVADAPTSNNSFIIPQAAEARFNIHSDAGDLSRMNVRHELGHGLGFGTLWEDNEIYNDGTSGNSNRTLSGGTPGHLLGPAALAAYQSEFDPTATFVPVELDGPVGTRHGHWNEADTSYLGDAGSAAIAISGPNIGQSLDHELMTGELSDPGWLSQTTRSSFYDLGYTLHVIPEPGPLALCGVGAILGFRRRRSG